jgi:hypothetical protein
LGNPSMLPGFLGLFIMLSWINVLPQLANKTGVRVLISAFF